MATSSFEPGTVEASQIHALKQRVRHRTTSDGKSTYFGKYVSQEGSEKLRTYEYHGADHSLVYKYVLTPMNNFLVELLPLWLAPNLITLIGLILVGGSHTLFIFLCPLLEGEVPWWAMVIAAVTLFGYQTLDNLDGKQARRTNSSSPLGLLFDHGCDALNISVGTMTMVSIMQMGATWKTVGFVLSGHFVFIFATWEEYYSGSLELPIFNGPTEGILIGIALKLFTAIVGVDFWKEESIEGVQNNSLFVIVTMIGSCFTLMINVRNTMHAVRLNQDSVLVAFTRLLPFVILNALAGFWALFSPSDIFSQHPRMFLWMLGLLNSKLVLHLMLAHLCGEEYHPFRKTLVPIFYVAGHCAFCMLEGVYDAVNEELIVREFFFLSLAAYVHIVFTVVWEVKNVLGVSVFLIPHYSRLRAQESSKPAAKSS
ncbi:cdpalcohol phosphatidyltransferase [Plasmopara halstedii]|uniref:Cdpalcohol phosphatidyltransferase n=1 Tax=Plasmopara halstedii TaxID=4781 RepID=A0A0P1AGD2_PLAHL|nr:cdpalcohol phosphatidyltransferase [Plasmopara halstedii]CEG39698.1 cdpalcohol phosphatidyltransferase [Plasmopara halstedii]|eukprot:XP_024576067.1 cdpalcohol phosphatidyltransferase [Plasmopara halstedii]